MKLCRSILLAQMILCFALLSLNGCAAKKAGPSGFLGGALSYASMKENEFGIKSWNNPELNLSEYNKFIIAPVQVNLSSQGEKRHIGPKDLAKLARDFQKSIVRALQDNGYIVTHLPGVNTAVIRAALTDTNPNFVLLNIHPGTTIIGRGRGGASFEAMAIDSRTYETIAMVMDTKKGAAWKYTKGWTKWGHTEGVFNVWANTLVKRLNKAHGKN